MFEIDVKHLSCPEPLIRVKRFLEENPGQSFRVIFDSEIPFENVKRFLTFRGIDFEGGIDGNIFFLTVETFGENSPLQQQRKTLEMKDEPNITAFLSCDVVGRGDDELGRLLMHSFLKTLAEIRPKVGQLILMNGGVRLAAEDSEYLPALNALVKDGITIYLCGTCLDFFQMTNEATIGIVSNMYEICTILASSDRVLKF